MAKLNQHPVSATPGALAAIREQALNTKLPPPQHEHGAPEPEIETAPNKNGAEPLVDSPAYLRRLMDEFALGAMKGLLSHFGAGQDPRTLLTTAYRYADAALLVRRSRL